MAGRSPVAIFLKEQFAGGQRDWEARAVRPRRHETWPWDSVARGGRLGRRLVRQQRVGERRPLAQLLLGADQAPGLKIF
jgi:hypothetical protein